ncbi:MAG: DUF4258 domain-containing protein [Lachnospiraceae bacterium]|nr:DUF4258 domain-containing protein [Lachnospiraceae bacterium]
MDLGLLRELFHQGHIKWTAHCLERMQERDISIDDVENALLHGEMIEDYPDDYPHPSCLLDGRGRSGKRIHVVAGTDGEEIYVITAYEPNIIKFAEDGRTRRN